MFDRVAAEVPAGGGREQRLGGVAADLVEPGFQGGFGGGDQRCPAFLAAFADGVHVRASAQGDVAAGEAGEFGDPQPGLDGQGEHRVVASAGPGALIAGRE